MPKISVIVPVYNVEAYIHRCVDSILNQTFQDFELILVDDGSPDNCPKICDEYAQKDKRVIVIHKENGWAAEARNRGLDWVFENSDSDWITFIDSDDWVHEQYLELLYKGAVENNCEISIVGFVRTEEEETRQKYKDYSFKNFTADELWKSNRTKCVVPWCKLYKKNLWVKHRFPKVRMYEDEFTVYKVLFSALELFVCDQQLYYYFHNQNGATSTKWDKSHLVKVDALREQTAFFKKNKYKKAYRRNIPYNTFFIWANLKEMEQAKQSDEDEKICRNLKAELRMNLRKHFFKMPIIKWTDMYITAFPERKKNILFWVKIRKMLSKIKGKLIYRKE